MIAALFVDPKGTYAGLPDVELWDEQRDARTYAGPWPVVAHPPCATWCRLAGLVEARWGKKRGEDGGCFAAALEAVRRWGGVLEHPAYTDAWRAFRLPRPQRGGGWQRTFCGGWVCQVEQGRYSYVAKKATWLYAHGIDDPPALRWGFSPHWGGAVFDTPGNAKRYALVSWCGNHTSTIGAWRRRVSKKAAAATPSAFRDVLLDIARSVQGATV